MQERRLEVSLRVMAVMISSRDGLRLVMSHVKEQINLEGLDIRILDRDLGLIVNEYRTRHANQAESRRMSPRS